MPRIPKVPEAISRRDFLRKIGGAAAAAALPQAPAPAPAALAAAVARSIGPADHLPDAFASGFQVPGAGGGVLSLGDGSVLHVDGSHHVQGARGRAGWQLSKDQLQEAQAALRAARDAAASAPHGRRAHYNFLTKQWHELTDLGTDSEALRVGFLRPGVEGNYKYEDPLGVGELDFQAMRDNYGTLDQPPVSGSSHYRLWNHDPLNVQPHNQIDVLASEHEWGRAPFLQGKLREYHDRSAQARSRGQEVSPEQRARATQMMGELGRAPGVRQESPFDLPYRRGSRELEFDPPLDTARPLGGPEHVTRQNFRRYTGPLAPAMLAPLLFSPEEEQDSASRIRVLQQARAGGF